ncbi:MAG: hypothetical protein ABW095_03290 [Candidatus Thiodiazotropha sp.]
MEKKIIIWVVSLSLVAVALAILLPGGRKADSDPKLPWDIQITEQQQVQVFGLTLDESNLQLARDTFQDQGKLNIFVSDQGVPALEAYFERVFLSGLRADIILTLKTDRTQLEQMMERGSRISRTSDTTHKIALNTDDQVLAAQLPISLINYVPAANLDEELVLRLFGEPADKITEVETGITQWIYPGKGLSIGLNPEGRELLQYMPLKRVDAFIQQIEQNNRQYEASHEKK